MNRYLAFFAFLLLSGCAAAPAHYDPAAICDDPSGFLGGLWHGMIIQFSFIGSLFDSGIYIYAPCNNGGWYDFGFFLGASSALGSSAGAARAARNSN